MKRTLLITVDFAPQVGGVANYLAGLTKNLPAGDLVVLAPKVKANFDNQFKFKIYRRNLFWRFWPKWLPMVYQIFKIARAEKVEFLWAAQPLPVGSAIYLVSRLLGLPYLVNTHGMDVAGPLNAGGRRLKILKRVLGAAKLITVNSDATKKLVLKLTNQPDKILKIYPCPELLSPSSPDRENRITTKHGLGGKKVLLTVGRLVKRKGHEAVIQALPEVLKTVPNLIYLIAGDGENKANLLELIKRLNLGKFVILAGQVAKEDLPAYYRACSAFIMPSQELAGGDIEGFGLVFLEAGLYGKPVIAGQTGGQAEAVLNNQTGLLVDPADTAAIAEAIIKLLTDESLARQLGESGRSRAEKDFKWETEARRLEKFLK
ncbi:MAG: glycosyltransferase family 4 protein [Patescibacteria group bacterium]|jgi:phosphatidylinositol alpha-1,6-mannosyltransferase